MVNGETNETTYEYTYDALGQLLTETVNGVAVNTMTYDNYGNILTKNGKTYTYGDSKWKDLLTEYDGQTITYDDGGNPINYLGHTLTWEKGRQLKSFDDITYTYNANGIRTSKTVNGVKHEYTLDGTNIVKETWDGNTLVPLYDNTESVCGITYNGTSYYFLKNLQGDVIAITDSTGSVVARYSYDAWGVCTIESDTTDCNIAEINPYRYRGYYLDREIGMYYLQSRYYDPQVGRFINADEVFYAVMIDIALQYNLFTYCFNDSIGLADSDGHAPLSLFKTSRDAVRDFANNYYNVSLFLRMEISSLLFAITKNRRTYYAYTPYIIGNPHSCQPLDGRKWIPKGGWRVGGLHTHPNSNFFSNADKKWAKKYGSIYVVVPNRSLRVYHDTRRGWKDEVLFKNMTFKKLTRDVSSRLRYQYRSVWLNHIKTKCDFKCSKKRWPGDEI